jgi:hypothetical protein
MPVEPDRTGPAHVAGCPLRHRQLDRELKSADPRRQVPGMLDAISGGRLVARASVGTPMDELRYGARIPARTRDKYRRPTISSRCWASDEWSVRRWYNQLRWVNCWPKPYPEAAPADLHPGRGRPRRGFLPDYDYNYCICPLRYSRASLLATGSAPSAEDNHPTAPRSRRSSASRHRRRGRAARRAIPLLASTGACTLPALCGSCGLPHDAPHRYGALAQLTRPAEDPRESHPEAVGR